MYIAHLSKVIVGGAEPCDAFRPIAEMEIRPFRDAGSSIMEWGLHIQVSFRQSAQVDEFRTA